MEVQGHPKPSFRPLWPKVFYRTDGRIDRLLSVISIVVMGATILPLIAIFHPVFVHEWYDGEFHILAEPGSIRPFEDSLRQAFQDPTGHHFAGMVPAGNQDPMTRAAGEASEMEPLCLPAFSGHTMFDNFQVRIIGVAMQKPMQVCFEIWHGQAKAGLWGIFRNANGK